MAYNPGVQHRGDLYMYQAIASLGEQAGKAFTQYRQDRAKSQFLDQKLESLMRAAQQHRNLVDPSDPQVVEQLGGVVDELGRLGKMSLSQKEALAGDMEFRLNSLLQAAGQRQQARRGDAYLGLQRKNTELNEQRAEREKEEVEAGRRFFSSLAEPKSVPGQWDPDVSVSPAVRPEGQQRTVDDFLRAAASAGRGLDPRHLDTVDRLLTRQREGWDLRPGQTVPLGEGVTGVATSPQQLQLLRPPEPTRSPTAYRTIRRPNPDDPLQDETIRIPMTPEEVAQYQPEAVKPAAPATVPDNLKKLVKEYAVHAAEVDAGDKRNWRGADRSKRMQYIRTQLASMGYDTRGQPLTAATQPAGAPSFGELRPGQTTNWHGFEIELLQKAR